MDYLKFTLNLISEFIRAIYNSNTILDTLLKIEKYKKGNKIKIKKENRGKFTESAKRAGQTVLQYARTVMSNPNSSKLLRKRATFAINSSKWKHGNV